MQSLAFITLISGLKDRCGLHVVNGLLGLWVYKGRSSILLTRDILGYYSVYILHIIHYFIT